MNTAQNAQVSSGQVDVPTVPAVPMPQILTEDGRPLDVTSQGYKRGEARLKKTIEEQQQTLESIKKTEQLLYNPIAPVAWMLIGIFMYLIIKKIIENKRTFLDCVDRMHAEVKFLHTDDEEMANQLRRIDKNLENLEEKVLCLSEKNAYVLVTVKEMQQDMEKKKAGQKKVFEKAEPICLPDFETPAFLQKSIEK